jgi:hypothetical protein
MLDDCESFSCLKQKASAEKHETGQEASKASGMQNKCKNIHLYKFLSLFLGISDSKITIFND